MDDTAHNNDFLDAPEDQNELNEQLYFNRISDLDSGWFYDSIFESDQLDSLVTAILNNDAGETGRLMIKMARDCAFPKE